MTIGYNGVQRLPGQLRGRGRARNNTSQRWCSSTSSTEFQHVRSIWERECSAAPFNGGGGGMFNTGTVGPLRFFAEPLGGQIGWV